MKTSSWEATFLSNMDSDMIWDPSNSTNKLGTGWNVSDLHCADNITIKPTNTKIVTIKIFTRRGFRLADASDAIAVVSSCKHLVQGEPALVQINKLGQVDMEIFNCTNCVMKIDNDSSLGIIKNIHSDKDSFGKLNVSSLTAQLEELEPAEKKKFILENTQLNVPEEFKV